MRANGRGGREQRTVKKNESHLAEFEPCRRHATYQMVGPPQFSGLTLRLQGVAPPAARSLAASRAQLAAWLVVLGVAAVGLGTCRRCSSSSSAGCCGGRSAAAGRHLWAGEARSGGSSSAAWLLCSRLAASSCCWHWPGPNQAAGRQSADRAAAAAGSSMHSSAAASQLQRP